jgi:hypothetical protein
VNAVLNRLPQVCAECMMASGLELIETAEGLKHRVLDQVRGVDGSPRPHVQPPMCPALEPGDMTCEERIEGRTVTAASASEQLK